MGMRSGVLEGRRVKPPKKEPDIPEDELEDLSISKARRLLTTRDRPRYPPSSARRYAHSDMNVELPSGSQRIAQRSMSTPNVSTDSGTFEQYHNAQSLSNTIPDPQAGSGVARPYQGNPDNQDPFSTNLRSHVQTTGFAGSEQSRGGGSAIDYRPERRQSSTGQYSYNQPRSNSMQGPSHYGLNVQYNLRGGEQNTGSYRTIHAFDTFNPISSHDASSLPMGSAERHALETLEPEQISPRGSMDSSRPGENRSGRGDIGNSYDPSYVAAHAAYPEHSNGQRRMQYTGSGGRTYHVNMPVDSTDAYHNQDSGTSMPDGPGSSSSTYPVNRDADFEAAGDTVTHTGINLRRSYLANKERSTNVNEENPFQESVKVWQHGYPNPAPPLDHIILILDTGCENSNWVAEQIIADLGAEKKRLPCPAEFITFNGETMNTEWEATLSFRSMTGVKKYTCNFLVAVNERTPFDMVIGRKDIMRHCLLTRPQGNFGLGHKKQDKAARREEALRIAEQEKNSERHADRVRQMEEQRRRDDLARRSDAQNQGDQNNWNNASDQGGQSNWTAGYNQGGQSNWNAGYNQGGQSGWNNDNNQEHQKNWNSGNYYGGGR